jgi:hypothetical protein
MAIATGAVSSYDVNINREDLSGAYNLISPTETPFLSAIGRTKATSTNHQWSKDAIRAAAANVNLEGGVITPAARDQASKFSNYTQILVGTAVITGTQQDGVDEAGVKDKMAREIALEMKALKLDLEAAMIGTPNAKVEGDTETEREMASFTTYLITNTSRGVDGADPTGDGTDAPTEGTERDYSEALLTTVLSSCFTEGADPKLMFVSATNKAVVDGFTGGGTHYIDKDDREVVNSVDVYVGGLGHTLKVVPARQLNAEDVLLVDPEFVQLADMRPIHSFDLPKDGDYYAKAIVQECTLQVSNEAAHGIVADTNG